MVRICITGGTGSLGSHLVPYYLKKKYKVRVLSRDENKQSLMIKDYPDVEFVLGDVRDLEQCKEATKDCDIVIHAAALKRVEFGEEFPLQFIKTNVLGTRNMVKASRYNKVPKFVLVSTDKAVKPINTYGMCKALAEKLVVNEGYNCVRYGNVNNSRGSVLPYWKELKKKGELIPLTSGDMTRFMIDFKRAVQTIEYALEKMKGSIYVPILKAANIVALANCYGIPEIIGERPGEKLHEVLVNEDEYRNRLKIHKDYYEICKDFVQKRKSYEFSSEVAPKYSYKELERIVSKL